MIPHRPLTGAEVWAMAVAGVLCGWPALAGAARAEGACGAVPAAVQVLGSGGPIADDGRASSGYLVWVEGRARLLVDVGGGVFLRFGETHARIEDLDLIALTHLHTDHSADLPALLKSGFFSERTRALPISGPSGSRYFPPLGEFLHDLFNPARGAYRYLAGFLDGTGGLFETPAIEIDAHTTEPTAVLTNGRLRVHAVGVKHGPVPARGYRVTVHGTRIAFSGDQNGDNPAFARMIQGADVLVMDHAIPEHADPVARALHADPASIGRLAARAEVGTLVLSHLMARSLGRLEENLSIIRRAYAGRVVVAKDLMCLPVGT